MQTHKIPYAGIKISHAETYNCTRRNTWICLTYKYVDVSIIVQDAGDKKRSFILNGYNKDRLFLKRNEWSLFCDAKKYAMQKRICGEKIEAYQHI